MENDAILITFSDLKRLFLRHRSAIQWSAIICGLCVFAFTLLREPQYHAEATFKQASRQNDVSMNMKELFQHVLPASSENGAMTIMRSNELLKDVVEIMGLQVHCEPDFFLLRAFKRIWENALCELSKPLSDPDIFRFSNVSYDGEDLLRLQIKLIDDTHYQLLDSQKKLIAEAALGEPVKIGNATYPGDVATDRGGDRGAAALERRVHDVDFCGEPERLADDVVRGAGAGRSIGDRAGLRSRERDQLLE